MSRPEHIANPEDVSLIINLSSTMMMKLSNIQIIPE